MSNNNDTKQSSTATVRKYPTVQANTTFYSSSRANPSYHNNSISNEATSLLYNHNSPYNNNLNHKNNTADIEHHANGSSNNSTKHYNNTLLSDNDTAELNIPVNHRLLNNLHIDTTTNNININSNNNTDSLSPQSPIDSPLPTTRIRSYSTVLTSQITRRMGHATSFQIFIFILKLCTGAGLLGLSKAFDSAGIVVSIILTCILTCFAVMSCNILLRSREIMLVTKQHFQQSNELYSRTNSYETFNNNSSSDSASASASDSDSYSYNDNNGSSDILINGKSSTKTHDTTSSAQHDSFGELAYFTLGRLGTTLVDTSLIVSFLGAVAIYLITITQLLHEVFPHISMYYFTIFCTIFLLPFALIRELTWLNGVTILATLAYVVGFIVIFIYGFGLQDKQQNDATYEKHILHNTKPISWLFNTIQGCMIAFGTLTFSLDTPTMVFMFEEEMKEPEKFTRTLYYAMSTVCVTLICVGTLGVYLFHYTDNGVQSIIISNLPSSGWITNSVKIAVAITLLLSAPLSLSPALNLFEHVLTNQHNDSCHEPLTIYEQMKNDQYIQSLKYDEQLTDHTNHNLKWYRSSITINLIRIATHLLVVLLAFTVPNFTLIISILGCLTFALLCYILPPLFYILLHRKTYTQLHRHYQRAHSQSYNDNNEYSLTTYYIFNIIYLIVGTCCSTLATTIVLTSNDT